MLCVQTNASRAGIVRTLLDQVLCNNEAGREIPAPNHLTLLGFLGHLCGLCIFLPTSATACRTVRFAQSRVQKSWYIKNHDDHHVLHLTQYVRVVARAKTKKWPKTKSLVWGWRVCYIPRSRSTLYSHCLKQEFKQSTGVHSMSTWSQAEEQLLSVFG